MLEEYQQYRILFREIKDLKLPKYKLQNYKIELKEEIEFKFYCIYLFNNNKLEVFQKYIKKNLKKRYIRSCNCQQDIQSCLYLKKMANFNFISIIVNSMLLSKRIIIFYYLLLNLKTD